MTQSLCAPEVMGFQFKLPDIYCDTGGLGNFVFNGFTDDDSNTGWLVQLFIKGDELTWQVHEAKIDKLGIPKYSRAIPVAELVK